MVCEPQEGLDVFRRTARVARRQPRRGPEREAVRQEFVRHELVTGDMVQAGEDQIVGGDVVVTVRPSGRLGDLFEGIPQPFQGEQHRLGGGHVGRRNRQVGPGVYRGRLAVLRVLGGARDRIRPRLQQAGQRLEIASVPAQRPAGGLLGLVREAQRVLDLGEPRLTGPTIHAAPLTVLSPGVGVDSGQEGVRGEVLFGRDRRPHQFLVGEWLPALPEVILDLPPGLFCPSALDGQTQRDQCRHDHGAQGQRTPPRCPDRPEARGSQRHGPAIPEQRHQPCGQKERVFQPDMHPFGEGIP